MRGITEPAAHLVVGTLRLRAKRSFVRSPKRGTRIELPRKLWDRIVLLMFTCCLFTLLHAFFGFDIVDEGLHPSHDIFVHPHAPPRRGGSGEPNGDEEMRGVTRVTVDWDGNYERLPSTASALISPASIPQDAFPDPTAALVGAGSLSMTTKVKTPANVPLTFQRTPYDPFELQFEESVDGDRLYPVAGPPRTTSSLRTRRFGRCTPGGACS